MKRKITALSQSYATILKNYLREGNQATSGVAYALGRRAAGLGLQTLDMARIHDGALSRLSQKTRKVAKQRAASFFAAAIAPIESLHQAAVMANSRVRHLSKALDRRTVDLAASRKSVQQTITGRKTVEKALRKSGWHSGQLLRESRRLQKDLQNLAHKIIKAQEHKRAQISHGLRDEIAQTLLGINVRLLTLKTEASLNARSLAADIATTQRLLDKSVHSIKRYAGQLKKRHA